MEAGKRLTREIHQSMKIGGTSRLHPETSATNVSSVTNGRSRLRHVKDDYNMNCEKDDEDDEDIVADGTEKQTVVWKRNHDEGFQELHVESSSTAEATAITEQRPSADDGDVHLPNEENEEDAEEREEEQQREPLRRNTSFELGGNRWDMTSSPEGYHGCREKARMANASKSRGEFIKR